ncbi:hypothetical protein CHU92_15015 [Flavobacterium cyanobacteriorum]|uniref:Sugar-binding protein n=1 Tax=Flavobacterium cyanobacteriorum TaxID=2022802 RepID=A0A255YRW8_9FLAO|nr:RHS repeat domain-containing protein [Flavobacterium cyanobacteriorum]OYQ31952.1 hypothetical protein CHU92_15015 [Flavobacterium cyanobacteriorum]
MKYCPYLFTLLFLLSCSKKPEIDYSETDWAFYELKGNVKSMSEKSFAATTIPGKPAMNRENPAEHNTDLYFSEQGKLILEKKWIDNGQPFEETKYNGKNQKLSATQYINGKPYTITEYKWDKTGKINIVAERKNPDNTIIEKTIIKVVTGLPFERLTYNARGNLKEKIQYFYDNQRKLYAENLYYNIEILEQRTQYEYDAQNRKIAEIKTGNNGELLSKTTYQYEGQNISTIINYNHKNETDNYEKYEYDSKNNMTVKVFYSEFDKIESKELFMYNNKNKKTGNKSYENGLLQSITLINYDKSGNISAISTTNAEGRVTDEKRYTYTYDSQGNWITKNIMYTTGDKRSYRIIRKIEYY